MNAHIRTINPWCRDDEGRVNRSIRIAAAHRRTNLRNDARRDHDQRGHRRLAAVAFVDIVGYAILMARDEMRTHRCWMGLLAEVICPQTTRHRGAVVKSTGDGVLAEFPSALDAVEWAVAIQRLVSRTQADRGGAVPPILLRVAVHLGDVITTQFDIFGDGVNIAARLQAHAEPGGVVLSEAVYDVVRSTIGRQARDLGCLRLKKSTSQSVLTHSGHRRIRMNEPVRDIPKLVIFPPVIPLTILVLGIALQWGLPLGLLAAVEQPWRIIAGAIVLVAGAVMAASGRYGLMRLGTAVNPMRPAVVLADRGIFARMRNPMYVGITLALAGIALVFALDWILLLLPPGLVLLHFGVVLREERYLEQKFGDDYRRYKSAVPRYGWLR